VIGIDGPRIDHDAGLPESPDKPCCAALHSVDGLQTWCGLPGDHLDPASADFNPEHVGVTPRELAPPVDGKKWRPGWGK
jgi:hypothetical protein